MVIIYTSSRRAVLRRFAALLIAPQRFVCYIASPRSASRRSAPLLPAELLKATQRFVCYNASPRGSALCSVTRHNSTPLLAIQLNDLFVTTQRTALRSAHHLYAAPRVASPRDATQLKDLFVTSPRGSASRSAPRLPAAHRASTQRFVCYKATQRSPMQLVWPRRAAAHCLSPQLNELKLN